MFAVQRWARWSVWVAIVLGAAAMQLCASTGERTVVQLSVEGVINPLTASYLERGIERARELSAECLILQLDTPGGLDQAMREMVRAILSSPVPVVVYVAPSGARAASAGLFITIAAHVAAMAPGTNIGAAHPVPLGEGKIDSVMAEKILNDAMATIRAIAQVRKRNVEWVQDAVRRSVSVTDQEALKQGVIDLVAKDRDDLLRQLSGRVVNVAGQERTLQLDQARVVEVPMTVLEKFLHIITDPNIALLLLSLGFAGIIIEFYTPGSFGPGIAGAILLILGFMALGSLPMNWAGILLLVLAAVLLVLELYTPPVGVLALGSIVSFILGALILFTPTGPISPSMPQVAVSGWLIALLSVMLVALAGLLTRVAVRIRRAQPRSGMEALIGARGVAKTALEPQGSVLVRSELWTAVAEGNEPIAAGETVEVVGYEGTVLRVRKVATA